RLRGGVAVLEHHCFGQDRPPFRERSRREDLLVDRGDGRAQGVPVLHVMAGEGLVDGEPLQGVFVVLAQEGLLERPVFLLGASAWSMRLRSVSSCWRARRMISSGVREDCSV